MIGQTISHYKILDKLGEGGMGVVYKAQDTKLDRTVALKFLPSHITPGEAEKERFLQEAKAAAALNHPNICTIYGIEEHHGQQFIEMEYVEGVTVSEKLAQEPLPVKEAAGYAIQIGEALQDAHARGIVHRDIKSDNVMVNSKNQVKVMDFGLAKLKGSMKLTKASSTVGTLAYMAPEQIQGGEVDARSDIFSFGVLLYEMLTGKTPFRGEHEAAMVYSIVNEEPQPLDEHRKDLSPILVNLVQRCLEKNPEERYQTIHDAVIELRRSQKQTSKVHRTSEFKVAQSGSQSVVHPEPQPSEPEKAGNRKKKIGFIAALTVIVVVAAVFSFLEFGGKEQITYSLTDMEITPVTTEGNVFTMGLSPDGQYAVYGIREKGMRSLWVKHLTSGSTVQALPPTRDEIGSIEFSGNSSHFFYLVRDKNNPTRRILTRIPVLGGSFQTLRSFENLMSYSLSVDGKRVAYTRQFPESGEFSLMISDIDGSNERRLASDKAERWYHSRPSWSPDGSTIMCPWGTSAGRWRQTVMAVRVADGSTEDFVQNHFAAVSSVTWIPDGQGVVIVGGERQTQSQIWTIPYPGGKATRFTNDLLSYSGADLSADGSVLGSVAYELSASLSIADEKKSGRSRSLASSRVGFGGFSWTPDGSIVYAAGSGNQAKIFIMKKDGSENRQLTFGEYDDYLPVVSRDGSMIAFTSERSGTPRVWVMRADGSDQRMVSNGNEDYAGDFTADGSAVLYMGWDFGPPHVMRASLQGGKPERLSEAPGLFPHLSPDGSFILYSGFNVDSVYIMPADGGSPTTLVPQMGKRSEFGWSKDGRSVTYLQTDDEVSNLWEMSLDRSRTRKLTSYSERGLSDYRWSRDYKDLGILWNDTKGNVVVFRKKEKRD